MGLMEMAIWGTTCRRRSWDISIPLCSCICRYRHFDKRDKASAPFQMERRSAHLQANQASNFSAPCGSHSTIGIAQRSTSLIVGVNGKPHIPDSSKHSTLPLHRTLLLPRENSLDTVSRICCEACQGQQCSPRLQKCRMTQP